MLKSPFIFAVSLLVAWLSPTLATKASSPELDFSLPSAAVSLPNPKPALAAASKPAERALKPLPVPPAASQPPVSTGQSLANLTPPSPVPQSVVLPPIASAPRAATPPPARLSKASVGLEFELATVAAVTPAEKQAVVPASLGSANPSEAAPDDRWIFNGGSDSLVARTVGSAEGTRSVNGDRNRAYYGHTDPGNGVWNLGTFSYQHGARSPEEADAKQLQRLQSQAKTLDRKAQANGLKLSLDEKLNGLDLANQAPLAALDRGGYIERLAEAYQLGMSDREAILYARTRAYIDPDTQRWNAPGLGNNIYSISRDQERRIDAIAAALGAFDQANTARGEASAAPPSSAAVSVPDTKGPASAEQPAPADESGDIFQLPGIDLKASVRTSTVSAELPAVPREHSQLESKSELASFSPQLTTNTSEQAVDQLGLKPGEKSHAELDGLVDQFLRQDLSNSSE